MNSKQVMNCSCGKLINEESDKSFCRECKALICSDCVNIVANGESNNGICQDCLLKLKKESLAAALDFIVVLLKKDESEIVESYGMPSLEVADNLLKSIWF